VTGIDLQLLEVNSPTWEDAYWRLPIDSQDIFYHPKYARLYAETVNRRDRVLCAYSETPNGPILYPFVLRDLSVVTDLAAGLSDMTGLYGRNGAVCGAQVTADDLSRFHTAIAAFANETGVLTSFDRFHPVLSNERLAALDSRIFETGVFVIINMDRDMEAVESGYRYSVRKDIRKAERFGISTFAETNGAHLDDFIFLYEDTMKRNNASSTYYFSREFFDKIIEYLKGQFIFIYAIRDGEIVSCELALLHGHYGHSFLGGTRKDALPLAANHLLKQDLIRELKRRSCRFFLLGGGKAPGDGIEKYKLAYAPDTKTMSRVGGRVFDQGAFDELRERMLGAGRLPHRSRFQFYDQEASL